MRYKKTKIAAGISLCLLGILMTPWGQRPLIWLAIELSARHQDIGIISSIPEEGLNLSVQFPRERRGWPIYVDEEATIPKGKRESGIELQIVNEGEVPFDVTIRQVNSRDQRKFTMNPGDRLDAINTTLEDYIYESKRSNRIKVCDDGYGEIYPPLIYFRSTTGGRLSIGLYYSSEEAVFFDPTIYLYSAIPRDTL